MQIFGWKSSFYPYNVGKVRDLAKCSKNAVRRNISAAFCTLLYPQGVVSKSVNFLTTPLSPLINYDNYDRWQLVFLRVNSNFNFQQIKQDNTVLLAEYIAFGNRFCVAGSHNPKDRWKQDASAVYTSVFISRHSCEATRVTSRIPKVNTMLKSCVIMWYLLV